MAIYPGANSVTLVEEGDRDGSGDQPIIVPIGIILHTNGSPASCSGMLGLMNRTDQEFHFEIEDGGRVCQFVHTDVRADNNFRGNSFTLPDGRLGGYISIETSDRGSPYELSWTDLGQRKPLEDLLVWLCTTHKIPAVRCASPTSPGIGYHAQWGFNTRCSTGSGTYGVYTAPGGIRACLNNPWTNALGKICPGPGKIREFTALLDAVARRVAGGAPTPTGDDMDILVASSDGSAEQKNTWFIQVGATINALPTSQTRTDVVSLMTVRKILDSNNQQPWRNYTVSDIQALINTGWTGARSAVPTTVGGFSIPADPAAAAALALVKPVENGFTSTNKIMSDAFGKVATTVHLQEVEDKVDLIPKTPGTPGSGGPQSGTYTFVPSP